MTAADLIKRLQNVDENTPVKILGAAGLCHDVNITTTRVSPTTNLRWWQGRQTDEDDGIECVILFKDTHYDGDPTCA